jgi:hypothetical protein
MRSAVRQWLRKLRESLPEPQILLVPGHFFYTHRFEIAAGMSRAEIESFLALSLEGSAPFPVEHLAWGYFHLPGESHALVFATTQQRLRGLGEFQLESFFHAFPGFVSRLGAPEERAKVRFVAQNGSLSAVFLPAGRAVPEQVVSRPITAELLTDGAILAARSALARTLESRGFDLEDGVWIGDGFTVNARGQPVFRHRRIGTEASAATEHALAFDPDILWGLDLRTAVHAQKQKRERLLAHRLWSGVQAIAAGLLLCLLLGFGILGLERIREWTDSMFLARYARAEQISEDERFIERLATDSAQSLDPVQMLTMVNDLRPDAVFFRGAGATRAEESGAVLLSFDGECRADVAVVNAYADNIRALDAVIAVDPVTDIRDGRTFFRMSVTFDPARLALERRRQNGEDVAATPAATPAVEADNPEAP